MAQLEVEFTNTTMRIRSQAFSCEFPEVEKNTKAVLVFLRKSLSPRDRHVTLHVSRARRCVWVQGPAKCGRIFWQSFAPVSRVFVQFLTRVNTKHDRLFPLVEAQILSSVFLSVHQHYLAFCESHPQERLSETTFREYVNDIDGGKILQRVRQVASKAELSCDVQRYLQEILDLKEVSAVKRKEIVEVFPTVEPSSSESEELPPTSTSSSRQSPGNFSWCCCMCIPCRRRCLLCCSGWAKRASTPGFMHYVGKRWNGESCGRLSVGVVT